MKAPSADLDLQVLRNCLGHHWGIVSPDLTYSPIGFGDHHWRATAGTRQHFVTVHDLRLDDRAPDPLAALEQTFQAVRALKKASRLPFLVPPLLAAGGTTIVRTATHFAVSVYDWLDVQPWAGGESAVAVDLVASFTAPRAITRWTHCRRTSGFRTARPSTWLWWTAIPRGHADPSLSLRACS